MILLKKFTKKIPSFRHKTDIQLFDNSRHNFNYHIKNTKLKTKQFVKHKKIIANPFCYNLHSINSDHLNLITQKYVYNFRPYKKIIICKTLNNITYNLPGIENVNIGKILFAHNNLKYCVNLFTFKGFVTYLYRVPTNTICSNVMDKYNTKITFAKAGGTYCKVRKNKRNKKKLLLIELPSKQEIFLTKYTKIYVGKNQNFRTNELTEGK
jgi:hypothetical protein